MAITPVEFESPSGLTLTLELYPHGSDVIANGVGDTCTEETNRHGVYSVSVTEALTGLHHAIIVDGSNNLIATYSVDLLDNTSIYRCSDLTTGLNDLSSSEVNAEVDTALADYDGPTNAEMVARTLLAADYFDPATDTVANVTTVATTTTNTDMRGTNSAATAASVAALNNVSTVQVNAEVDTALADYDGPTNTEMNARTLLAAGYFDPATDTVANVTTVSTTTTNTDMRGTDSAATAANLATAQSDLDVITGTTGALIDVTADVYHALIEYAFDDPKDEYTVTWFKNGARVTSGITVPTIQVVKRSDGTDLVSSTAMTQIGSTGSYKYDEATNVITVDEAYLTVVSATIDGGSRSFACLVSRSA
jgi:hypothetical protein